ncbi:hypothetical protein F5Y06DRAFT_132796 [Hypoxylon sp. FL0890]|nr:hypothetical protein F5Y06DRAFT_132796 [Hypoxylon sp. FL0890]
MMFTNICNSPNSSQKLSYKFANRRGIIRYASQDLTLPPLTIRRYRHICILVSSHSFPGLCIRPKMYDPIPLCTYYVHFHYRRVESVCTPSQL